LSGLVWLLERLRTEAFEHRALLSVAKPALDSKPQSL